MKKLMTALVVAAFAGLVLLPGPAAADVQFGIKVGGNIANLTGADTQDIDGTLKTKVGFMGGVFLAFNFGSVVTIQNEVLYTMKGAALRASITTRTRWGCTPCRRSWSRASMFVMFTPPPPERG